MLKAISNHFEKFNFVNFKVRGKNIDRFLYGAPGELLVDNIRREWLYNVSLYRENNVFPIHVGEDARGLTKDYVESFLKAKQFNNSELPFGVVGTRAESNSYSNSDSMCPKKNIVLRYFGFFSPSEAEQFYYRWQLQRKRWWRKFSNDPGKFAFAESCSKPDGIHSQSIILAKFPWGDHEVETVKYHGSALLQSLPKTMQNCFQIQGGKTKGLPHVVESLCSLDYAAWTYLCDAYFKESEDDQTVIRLHKKLAPYKFTAAAPPVSNDKLKELLDLSHLIMLELRKEGISCLLPVSPPFGLEDLDVQFARSNALAIPYTAVLTLDTLQTGIFGLYSRETTLQEQVHLSKIKEYGQILMEA